MADGGEVELTCGRLIARLLRVRYDVDADLTRFLEGARHEEIVCFALEAYLLGPFLGLDVEPLEFGGLVEKQGQLLADFDVQAVPAQVQSLK